jgi:hypothetical protein
VDFKLHHYRRTTLLDSAIARTAARPHSRNLIPELTEEPHAPGFASDAEVPKLIERAQSEKLPLAISRGHPALASGLLADYTSRAKFLISGLHPRNI